MQRFISKIRKSRKIFLASTFFFSSGLGLSVMTGYFTARFIAGPRTYERGRLPSIVLNLKKYRIHLHHWLVFLFVLVILIYINFVIVSPKVFYGFFGGIIYQGISYYDDWRKIIFKNKAHIS